MTRYFIHGLKASNPKKVRTISHYTNLLYNIFLLFSYKSRFSYKKISKSRAFISGLIRSSIDCSMTYFSSGPTSKTWLKQFI